MKQKRFVAVFGMIISSLMAIGVFLCPISILKVSATTTPNEWYIYNEEDYCEFVEEVNGAGTGENFAGTSVYICGNIEFSEDRDFSTYNISRDFAGSITSYGQEVYKISGIKITKNDTEDVIGFINELSGPISRLWFDITIDLQSAVRTTVFSGVAGKVSAGGRIENCGVNITVNNNSGSAIQVSAITGSISYNAKSNVDNIYIDSKLNGEDITFYPVTAICKQGRDSGGIKERSITFYCTCESYAEGKNLKQLIPIPASIDPATGEFPADAIWVEDNENGLRLLIKDQISNAAANPTNPNKTPTTPDNDEESTTPDNNGNQEETPPTEIEPVDIEPMLTTASFMYNGNKVTEEMLGIKFKNTDKTVDYTVSEFEAKDVGTYEITIALTEDSSKEFTLLKTKLTFEITPYELVVVWSEESKDYTFTYDGQPKFPKFTQPVVDFDLNLELTPKEKFTDASLADYTAELEAPKNYKIKNATHVMRINAYEVAVSWSDNQLYYTGKQQSPVASCELPTFAGDLKLEYGCENAEDGIYAQDDNNPDSYVAIAKFNKNTTNFKLTNYITHFYIEACHISVEWTEQKEFEFNNEEQKPTYALTGPDFINADDFYMTINGNKEGTSINRGEYTAEIKCLDTRNYYITNETRIHEYKITPKVLTILWGSDTLYYNGMPQAPTFEIENKPTYLVEALKYSKMETFASTKEYETELKLDDINFSIYNASKKFTILPRPIVVTCKNTQLTYNGTAQLLELEYELPELGDKIEITQSNAGTDRGLHTMTLSVTGENASNYILSKTTIEYSISTKYLDVVWEELDLIYNSNEQAPVFSRTAWPEFSADLILSYSFKASEVDEGYSTTLSIINNLKGNFTLRNETTNFNIIPAGVKMIWTPEDFEYNGKMQAPLCLPEKSYVKSTDYYIDNTGSEVGEYIAKAVSKNKNFYFTEDSNTCKYSIIPYKIKLTWQDTTLIYAGYPQKPTVKYDILEFINDIDINVLGEKQNVGEYCATAQIIGKNKDKFTLINPTNMFYITQKEIIITWGNLTEIYTGSPLKPIFTTSEQFDDLIINCTESTNAGKYDITLTCDSANFILKNTKNTFTIQPKPITVLWENTTVVFNGQEQKPTATFEDVPLLIAGAKTNVGSYTAICSSLSDNYLINNPNCSFEIIEYIVSISWTTGDYVYNKLPQSPRPSYSLPDFASATDFNLTGINIQAGTNYEAKVITTNPNFKVENSTCAYSIAPVTLLIEWVNTTYTYKNALIYPEFSVTGTQDNILDQLDMRGVGKDAGDYTAQLVSLNSNYIISNSTHTYTIQPYAITATWKNLEFVYQAQFYQPSVSLKFPDFAENVTVIQKTKGMNVGSYTAELVLYQEGTISKNFDLGKSATAIFEIKPYTLTLAWSSLEMEYNGNIQKPTASFVATIGFTSMPNILINGGAVEVGGYTATATLDNPNFTLSNPTTAFTIYPASILFELGSGEVQVTTNESELLDNLNVTETTKEQVVLPNNLNYLVGFNIELYSAVPYSSSQCTKTQIVLFNNLNNTQNTKNNLTVEDTARTTYLITITLDSNFKVPSDAQLYLVNGETTELAWTLEGNKITFTTSKLGVVCLVQPLTPTNNTLYNILVILLILILTLLFIPLSLHYYRHPENYELV